MPSNVLADIYGATKSFIPHIEMAIRQYIMENWALPSRIDQIDGASLGYNIRKGAEYLKPNNIAYPLAEATAIPNSKIARARAWEIEPEEWGDKYELTDRLVMTDIYDVMGQVVQNLGRSLAYRRERNILNKMMAGLNPSVTLGATNQDFNFQWSVAATTEFTKRFGQNNNDGTLYIGLHPFQKLSMWNTFSSLSNSNNAPLTFRDSAANTFTVPTFTNVEYVVMETLPRNLSYRVRVNGTGGTFRLSVNGVTTAAITVSSTPATMVTNIKNALDTATSLTWTVTGSSLMDITVTSPATLFVDSNNELKVAIDYDNNPTLEGQKSAYDLVTGGTVGAIGSDYLTGADLGVDVAERSATVKSPVWFRSSVLMDVRQAPQLYTEIDDATSGRVMRWSTYEKYGVEVIRPNRGGFIVSRANSPVAV